jgi:Ca2+-binding EF-hand superfamily protein
MNILLKLVALLLLSTLFAQAKIVSLNGKEVEGLAVENKQAPMKLSQFKKYDKNRDGKLGLYEFPKAKRSLFYDLDKDRSGYVTRKEFVQQKKRPKTIAPRKQIVVKPKPKVYDNRQYDYSDESSLEANLYNSDDAMPVSGYNDYSEDYSENYYENDTKNYQEDYSQDYNNQGTMHQRMKERMNRGNGGINGTYRPPAAKKIHPFITKHDINYDNVLTKSEMPQRMKHRFRAWDINGNHRLNTKEVKRGFRLMKQKRQKKKAKGTQVHPFVKRHDRNRDGYLTRSEMPAKFKPRFKDWDRNRDGRISSKELKIAFRALGLTN